MMPLIVINFEQTWVFERRKLVWRRGGIMAIPKDENYKEYARNAAHCLNMLTVIKDPASRAIQREMAAEWMRLADVARRPSKRWQMQKG